MSALSKLAKIFFLTALVLTVGGGVYVQLVKENRAIDRKNAEVCKALEKEAALKAQRRRKKQARAADLAALRAYPGKYIKWVSQGVCRLYGSAEASREVENARTLLRNCKKNISFFSSDGTNQYKQAENLINSKLYMVKVHTRRQTAGDFKRACGYVIDHPHIKFDDTLKLHECLSGVAFDLHTNGIWHISANASCKRDIAINGKVLNRSEKPAQKKDGSWRDCGPVALRENDKISIGDESMFVLSRGQYADVVKGLEKAKAMQQCHAIGF